MGWCSATGIMDKVMAAAYSYTAAILAEAAHLDVDTVPEEVVTDAMRPLVAEVAGVLRDGDWDCIEEAEHFETFAQEMLGHSDDEHRAWLVEQVKDFADDDNTAEVLRWSEKLAAFQARKGTN
jgi:hypothetical protein